MSNLQYIFSRRCWVEGVLQPACIVIEHGVIIGLEERSSSATDFGDAIIMPGVIDAHVHINEPGRTDWEGFDSGTRAAAAGGVTSIVDMPLNSSPVTTTSNAFKEKLESSKGKMHVNVGFYGGLVPDNLQSLPDLAKAGVLGIKCFLTHSGIDDFPNVPVDLLYNALPLLSGYALPLLVHCELSDDRKASPYYDTYQDYLKSRPDAWETSAVQAVADAARETNGRAHIVHVSSAQSLALIREAREAGVRLTAETCPHYIFFNAEEIPDNQTIYKCAPPIRGVANNRQLINALRSGALDFLASDHSPAPPDLKEISSGDLASAWGGIAGLQFLLTASYTALQNSMTLEEFIPLLTEKPASFLHLHEKKGYLKTGYDADIVIWDPSKSHVVKEDEIIHRHKASPYIGKEINGKIIGTIVNGETVFLNDHFKYLNAGTWLLRK